MSTILIVDDDRHILRTLEIMLQSDGHEVLTAGTGEDAVKTMECNVADIAFVDLQLPGIDGAEVLRRLKDVHRQMEIVIITAYGSIESAVESMKEGAFDYLTKPFQPEQVRHRIAQIERVRRLNAEVNGLRRRLGELPLHKEFITQNPATLHLLETARNVAASDATILITGESGTGKTLLARLIHKTSARADAPFATVDCTCFQESLLESELFGHRKGAFTGAINDKQGKVGNADGGTLFLDEIAEVPVHLQGKLLRLVAEKTYERVGDPSPRRVNARIIAATNRDLESLVQEKLFRQDLFYRLNVVDLHIPALRHRREDIQPIVNEFLATYCQTHTKNVTELDNKVQRALLSYSWPGNVRELVHTIERAVLLAPGRIMRTDHLPRRLLDTQLPSNEEVETLPLAHIEEAHIRKALTRNLTQEETARKLGIDPATLWRKRKKYNI